MKKPEEIKRMLVTCLELNMPPDVQHVAMKDALAYIQQLEAQVPRWISASNPPKNWRENDKDKTLINYPVYSPDYGVDVGNWIETAKMWVVMGLPAKPTHWMPLPEPPEEEKHE